MRRHAPSPILLAALTALARPLAIGSVPLAPVAQAQPSSELDGFDVFVADVMRELS